MKQKWLITIAGTSLLIASLYYIGLQLWEQRQALSQWHPDSTAIITLIAITISYALANFCLSSAWVQLLRLSNETIHHRNTLVRIYGKSQIGKYLPGNVLHIAGRHVMARSVGMSHTGLTMAALYEILGLISASAIIASVASIFMPDNIATMEWLLLFAPIPLIAYLFSPLALSRIKPMFSAIPALSMLRPLGWYLVFFMVAGIGLLCLSLVISNTSFNLSSLVLLSAFAISWIIGFLTPGAPSGIGIREASLVLLLTPLMSEDSALIIAILYRVVTILGDVLFMLMTSMIKPQTPDKQA